MATMGKLNRDLSEQENCSGQALSRGQIVFLFNGHTYGCIATGGIAVSFEPEKNPFFEIPDDSVDWETL